MPNDYPRPDEILVVEIGPAYPTQPLSAEDEEARDLLRDAHIVFHEDAGLVLIRSGEGEARFRVQAFTTGYCDMPQQLEWAARLWQTEPWRASASLRGLEHPERE